MANEFENQFDETEDIGNVKLEVNVVKDMIPTYSSQKLCEMIICDRYFGCYRDIAIMCMTELASRRVNGDDFQFEKVIDEGYKQLPVLNFALPNIRDILQQAIGNRK